VHAADRGDGAGDGGFYLAAYLVCLNERQRSVEAAFYFQKEGPAHPAALRGG
jgi:hypothetical protein